MSEINADARIINSLKFIYFIFFRFDFINFNFVSPSIEFIWLTPISICRKWIDKEIEKCWVWNSTDEKKETKFDK